MQRNVAALEDGAGPDGEVFLALVAAVEAILARRDALAKATAGARGAVRPKALFHVDSSCFRVGKHLEKLEG